MAFELNTKLFSIKFGKTAVAETPQEANVKVPVKDYTYAPLRSALLPTPAELKFALMNVTADPRPLMDILRRLPEADPHIFSVANTRQFAILGYDNRVVPGEGLADSDEEQIRCDVIMNLLAKTNFQEFLTAVTNGINYGHAVVNPVWMLDGMNRYYPMFESIDAIHFAKKDGKVKMIVDKGDKDFFTTVGSRTELTGLLDKNQVAAYISGKGPLAWIDIDESNLIIVNSIPAVLKGWKKDYVGGLMRPGLYMSLLKYYSMLDWAKFNELFGMPMRVGKFNRLLSGDKAIEILKTAVSNMGTDASAVIDDTTNIEFPTAAGGTNTGKSTYEGFADHIERKQSMVFLGNNLTTELTGKYGSLAAAKEHTLVRYDYMWSDIQLIQPLVQKIIEKIYFYNFGLPKSGFYPRFEFFTEETKDLAQYSQVVQDLSSSGLKISKKWAYEYFKIEEPVDEEDSFGGTNNSPFNIPG